MLPTLAAGSVHTCVTSPPYYGLRDYGTATWEGGDAACDHRPDTKRQYSDASTMVGSTSHQENCGSLRGFRTGCPKCGARRIDQQIGLEKTPDQYVAELVAVFREVRRVLRDDGTLWLNLGDSYAASQSAGDKTFGNPAFNENRPSRAATKTPARQRGDLKPKDLLGIPWRVAFALQAPDYLGTIRNETDRAWLAGLVDGEGCITILEAKSGHNSGSSYPPILQVRMCDRECIDHAMRITGTGGESPAQYPASMEGQRPSYQWRIHGRKAADTIAEIYPFLLIKRKQAIVAWNHQAVRDSYETKRGVKIPAAALEKQRLCREIIQKLNQREPVDLPSWMVEPPPPIGPGWFLRQDVIWHKPNPMPESVRDRCTKAHEYIFLLAKSARYYYDAEAVAEASSDARVGTSIGEVRDKIIDDDGKFNHATRKGLMRARKYGETRNRRSVWTVTPKPFKGAHFATFPPDLIKPCILAGCPVGGTVLDPFNGSGTTGMVAMKHGRKYVGIELNPDYIKMSEDRITKAVNERPMFAAGLAKTGGGVA